MMGDRCYSDEWMEKTKVPAHHFVEQISFLVDGGNEMGESIVSFD